jgi:putative membrane protein
VTASIVTQWPFEPVVLAICVLALVLFFRGFFELRRRGRSDHAGWGRAALFVTAVCLMYAALASPISATADELLVAHMLEHLLLGDLAIVLGLLAVRGPLVFFLLPSSILAPLARSRGVRRFLHWLTGPWVALTAWTASLWAWHVPLLFDYAEAHPLVHELEHVSFLLGGFLVWNLIVDPARTGRLTVGGRLVLAVAAYLLGDFVMGPILSGRLTYPFYDDQADRLFGVGPAEDRRAAALLMLVEQTLTLGIAIVVLLLRYVDEASERATGADRAATP